MKWKVIIAAGFIFLISAYCTAKEQQVSQNPTDNHPSYKEFVSSHTFPYQAPPQRQNQLRQNYSRLTLDMAKTQVEDILGAPDYSQQSYSKSKKPVFLGWCWTYFFKKPDSKLTNLKLDKSINIFFKANDKTHWITSNIEGLADIGSPSQ